MVTTETPVAAKVTVILHCTLCGRNREMVSTPLIHKEGQTLKVDCEACSAPKAKVKKAAVASLDPQAIRDRQWQSLCPVEYQTVAEGGNTDSRVNQAKALHQGATRTGSILWSAAVSSLRIVFAGPSGALKTRYAWRIIRHHFDLKADIKEFTSWSFQAASQDAGGRYQSDQWMKALVAADLILIDDLGKAPWTENTWSAFFELIERRNSMGKRWIITMNDSRDDMRAVMGDHRSQVVKSIAEPLIRRLEEYAEVFIFEK